MEVRETAACGITEREFAIEVEPEELQDIYRIFLYVASGEGHYDEDAQEDLLSQMSYIVGAETEDEPDGEAETEAIRWQEEDGLYQLIFQETNCQHIYRIIAAVETPGEGFDKGLNARLAAKALELAPSLLENLPVINR